MRLTTICGVLLWMASCASADAKQLLVEYTGTVAVFSNSTKYGVAIPPNTAVSGQFIIDTATAPTSTGDPNNVDFRHQNVGDFTMNFPGLSVAASDYLIRVQNDAPQSNGQPAVDFFSIFFDSGVLFDPPDPAPDPFPFTVNGVALKADPPDSEQGFIELRFASSASGASALYAGAAAPSSLSFAESLTFADFDKTGAPHFSFFNDSSPADGHGGGPVLLLPQSFSVSVVPEPPAWCLGIVALLLLLMLWRQKVRTRVIA